MRQDVLIWKTGERGGRGCSVGRGVKRSMGVRETL